MTKEIHLTKGAVALVDDADYEWLSQFKWQATYDGRHWYAARNIAGRRGQRGSKILMHREIVNPSPKDDIDHRDQNGLNNTRANLRICNKRQNQANRGANAIGTSPFKGVSWDKHSGKWRASIGFLGKAMCLGRYDNPEQAARAYDAKARELFGEFARLNFQD